MWKRIAVVVAVLTLVAASVAFADDSFQGFKIIHVMLNNQEVISDVPAVNFFGRTMLPVRKVAELTGLTVDRFDFDSSTVYLSSKVDVAALQAENVKLKADLAGAKSELTKLQAQLNTGSTVTLDQTPNVKIMDYALAKTTYGDVSVVAVVQNQGQGPVSDVKVSMTATKDGQVVATGNANATDWLFATLQPDQKVSVRIQPSNPIPVGAILDFSVGAVPTNKPVPKVIVTASNLTRDSSGRIHAIGTVKNNDTKTVKQVEIHATFLDAKGLIIYSDHSYAAITYLQPGQTTSFDVDPFFDSPAVTKVEIYVAGYYPLL